MAESFPEIDLKLEELKKHLELNQIQSAQTLIDKIIILNPKYPPSLVGYAEVLICKSQYLNAHQYLDQAESIDPEYPIIYEVRSRIYMLEGKVNESSQAYHHYQELAREPGLSNSNPSNPPIIYTNRKVKILSIAFSGFCILIIIAFILLFLGIFLFP